MSTPTNRYTDHESALSARDRAVLADLARVRLLGAVQIERLHFREGSPLTQARRCRHTLRRLTDLGVLHRFDRRIGGVRAGSAGFVYGLSSAGQKLAGVAGGGRRRRPWEPSAPFMAHVLAVAEVYVTLREAERAGACELLGFDAEPACWRRFLDRSGVVVLKPDAYAVIGVGEMEDHVFVEVDRGTESLPVIVRKAQQYVSYWRHGDEQERSGVFPRVLFLVPDDTRRAAIEQRLRQQLDADSRRLFQVALAAETTTALINE